jgi:hypothetical protein
MAPAASRLSALGDHFSPTAKMAQPSSKMRLDSNGIPLYQDLPLQNGDPPYSAWGLYGANDQLGMLNRLTDERVAAAAKDEIKTGIR